MPKNASFQGYFTEVSFDTSSCHIFKMAIFQKKLVISQATKLGEMQVKKMILFFLQVDFLNTLL